MQCSCATPALRVASARKVRPVQQRAQSITTQQPVGRAARGATPDITPAELATQDAPSAPRASGANTVAVKTIATTAALESTQIKSIKPHAKTGKSPITMETVT